MLKDSQGYTTLQNNFVMAYTAFGMSTYANGLLSIIAAGSKAKTKNALMSSASEILSYPKIKAKIEAIEAARTAQAVVKTGMTVEKVQQMYEEDRQFAHKCNQAGACVTATTGIARLYGMDKDNAMSEKTVIVIGPRVENSVKQVESEVVDAVHE